MSLYVLCLCTGLILGFCADWACAVECPDGFVTHQGICYKEFAILANWDEATTYCEAYGAELAIVNNDKEEQFLTGYLQRLTSGYFNSGIFWLGGSDETIEGSWIWNKTGQQFSYSKWKTGEPNNAAGNENCLTMSFSDNFFWNDNNCKNKYNFVCEIRPSQLENVIG